LPATQATDLELIEAILEHACGLSLSKGLRRALMVSFCSAAEAQGVSQARFLQLLSDGDQECISRLVEHTVIGETYFFRHPEQFVALKELLKKELGQEGSLRIWSAACASGEEPYSIAMALLESGRKRERDHILATDISERALRLARHATYGNWSLRRLDPVLRERYFEQAPQGLKVMENVRRGVEFRQHNLVADPVPFVGLHLIFCRNVLIYFTPQTGAKVLHKLVDALCPGGLLVVGPVEVPQATPLELEWLDVGGVTLLRKPRIKVKREVVEARVVHPGKPVPKRPPAARRESSLSAVHWRANPPAEPVRPPSSAQLTSFERAREAARRGDLSEAERLARESASKELLPESYLLLATVAESRGDLGAAVDSIRRALYLDPTLATGHATLVALYHRLGRPRDAERARRNALSTLEGFEEAELIKGVEPITAGALRRALEQPGVP
jgi:chemotaxis protein methyltransferase CheR